MSLRFGIGPAHKGDLGPAGMVEGHETSQIDVVDHVAVDHEQRFVPEEVRCLTQGPCGALGLLLVGADQLDTRRAGLLGGPRHLVGQMMGIVDDSVGAGSHQGPHQPAQHSLVEQRQGRLRDPFRKGFEPLTEARRQDHDLHGTSP